MYQTNLDSFFAGAQAAIQKNAAKAAARVKASPDSRLVIKDMSVRADSLREMENVMDPTTFEDFVSTAVQYGRDANLLGYAVPEDLTIPSIRERYQEFLPQSGVTAPVGDPAPAGSATAQDAPATTAARIRPSGPPPLVNMKGPFGSDASRAAYIEDKRKIIKAEIDLASTIAEATIGNDIDGFVDRRIAETSKRLGVPEEAVWASPEMFEPILSAVTTKAASEGVSDPTLTAAIKRLRDTHKGVASGQEKKTARADAKQKERRILTTAVSKWIGVATGLGNVDALGLANLNLEGDVIKTYNSVVAAAAELIEKGREFHEIQYYLTQEFAGVKVGDKEVFPLHKIEDLSRVAGSPMWTPLQREAHPHLPKDSSYYVDLDSGQFMRARPSASGEPGDEKLFSLSDSDLAYYIRLGKGVTAPGDPEKKKVKTKKATKKKSVGGLFKSAPIANQPTTTSAPLSFDQVMRRGR